MYDLTIIGLGIDENDLTLSAINQIKGAKKLVVRTSCALSFNAVKNFNDKITSLDYVYEKSRNFNTLNVNLAKEVIDILKTQSVTYLVDGSATEDSSVKELLKRVKNVKVISGVSAKEKCLERLKISTTSCASISAYDILEDCEVSFPAVVYAIDSVKVASEIKLKLMNLIGEDIEVYVASNTYTRKLPLYELDRLKNYDYSTSLYLPKLELTKKQRFTFNDLLSILKVLRSENGCPWDKVQTPKSIEKNLIEETYELLDAVESGDDDKIIEEAGDVLLQVAFYVLFGEESGCYNSEDVLSNVCSKLITRHTHVFGKDVATNNEEALETWNKNKTVEKGFNTAFEYVDSVPKNLPSLMRAQKVGGRAGKYNFDFNNVEETYSKVLEELEEIKEAVKSGSKEEIEKECGDLLFSAVNTVRKLGVDAETALYKATNKFVYRFKRLEEYLIKHNKNFLDLKIEELDKYYNMLKSESVDGN
ncbi:MAG: nucleoside triphosphate pyrophosphohydrolase [Clostridia bacterium]|nr:nucleoside triphosphate pyrophosphohydrolase [Clostridia bacterium]